MVLVLDNYNNPVPNWRITDDWNSVCMFKCLLWDGEQMSRCVYMKFHIAVLQLHEAAPDLHLLPEGRQDLLLQ